MSEELARKRFTEFKQRPGRIPDADLDAFWATLAPATIDDHARFFYFYLERVSPPGCAR
jgi:hypothetical protein